MWCACRGLAPIGSTLRWEDQVGTDFEWTLYIGDYIYWKAIYWEYWIHHHHVHHHYHYHEDLPSPPLIREQGSSQAWLSDSPSHLVTLILQYIGDLMKMNFIKFMAICYDYEYACGEVLFKNGTPNLITLTLVMNMMVTWWWLDV